MRFTDAHAAGPLCHMSRYGLMTGRFPFRADVSLWRNQPLIESNQTTIASLLASSNYETAMVGKWHLGFEENGYDRPLPGGPVDRGFNSFFGIRASTDIPPYFLHSRQPRSITTDRTQSKHATQKAGVKSRASFGELVESHPAWSSKNVLPRFTDEAISVIENHEEKSADQPLFLYLGVPGTAHPMAASEAISWTRVVRACTVNSQ